MLYFIKEAFIVNDTYGIIFIKNIELQGKIIEFSIDFAKELKEELNKIIVYYKQAGRYKKTLCTDKYTEEIWTEIL